MKSPFRFSLRLIFVAMTVAALFFWWTTWGEPYTDYFAKIVAERLRDRVNENLQFEQITTDELMHEVGVDMSKLNSEESIEFMSRISLTLYRLSPSYALRVEEDTSGTTIYVHHAEVIWNPIASDAS